MGTENIINFVKINENVATAGQPTADQLRDAPEEGYQAVINLAPESAENYAFPDERGIVTALDMAYHNIPVQWTSPNKDDFDKFTGIMDKLRGKKVLIHCTANFRVTAFFSLYAMKREGWSTEQADQLIAKIWESRPDYRMDNIWKSFIKNIRDTF